MLDLKMLEKKLDSALEKETSESLSNWLLTKRLKNHSSYLGEGFLERVVGTTNGSFISIKPNTPIHDGEQAIFYGNSFNYQIAA